MTVTAVEVDSVVCCGAGREVMLATLKIDVDVKVKPWWCAMRIGELGRRAGVSTRTLRYYEEQGLLEPSRLPNGYRSYDDQDVEQVRRIRFLLAAGINTEMAREVLPCMVDDGGFLVPACKDLVAEFEREETRIADRIAELDSARTALVGIIAAAHTVTR